MDIQREDTHVTRDTEMGMTCLQAKGHQGWPAVPEAGRGKVSPRAREGAGPARTLTVDRWPPGLGGSKCVASSPRFTVTQARDTDTAPQSCRVLTDPHPPSGLSPPNGETNPAALLELTDPQGPQEQQLQSGGQATAGAEGTGLAGKRKAKRVHPLSALDV